MKARPIATRTLLAAWLAAMLFLGAYTTGAHSAALPKPSTGDAALTLGLRELQRSPSRPLAVHALYASCKCSQGIVQRLLARSRDPRFDEVILLVGTLPEEPELERHGFRVQRVTGAELGRRYHIEAAPLLVVTDSSGSVRYSGGYRKFKGSPSEDQAILDRVANGTPMSSLPTLGCAVSERLKDLIDPLRFRD